MKHAGAETLRRLAPLRQRLRTVPGLVERKPGIFFVRSAAFLHFHEDPAGIFADVRVDGVSFERLPVSTAADEASLLAKVAKAARRIQKDRLRRA